MGGYCKGTFVHVRFTQSARRHRVGRARAKAVLAAPVAILRVAGPSPDREMWMYLGDDDTGRVLEVGVLELEDGGLLVVHVMDLRAKYQAYYDRGKEETP